MGRLRPFATPFPMKSYLPLLLILLAVVAGYMFLATGPEDDPYDVGWSRDEADLGGRHGAPASLSADGVAPAPPDSDAASKKGRKPYRTVDPRTLPTGTLFVTLIGPDDKPIDGAELRLFVEPVRHGGFPTRLGIYEKDTGAWRFEKVRAGAVQVRLYSDHVARKIETVPVRADTENRVSIRVEPAGAIQYDVIAYDKTRPDPVDVTLYDQAGRSVKAWYQVRTTTKLTTPRLAETMRQGPEGILLGVVPGVYRLKVVSPAEEWDDAEVRVEAGQTARVSLEVRR
jgi:hypothetical protein